MFNIVSPEKAGISSLLVEKFVKALNSRGLVMHSVLLARGEDIFAECYWKPFDKSFCHRMYSETKSYVAVAIGLLLDDGKLKLSDKIVDHFPEKLGSGPHGYIKDLTIEQMLKMETCGVKGVEYWFYDDDPDRTHQYFNENKGSDPAGMRWEYDSCGSQVLCSLVEKLSGKSLFDFLNERIFSYLGTFKTATILKTKTDDSWGDSALLCTPRDMASFARFVMNYGAWQGKRLMSEDYLKTATSRLVDNNLNGFDGAFSQGYGYQIWRVKDGFAFNGMGAQLTLCIPSKDLIFVCTADNQGFVSAKDLILSAFYEIIVDNMGEPLEEDDGAYANMKNCFEAQELYSMTGDSTSPFEKELNGKVYTCEENPMGIKTFSLKFNGDGTGEFHFENAQGKKVLPFGLCKNVFSKFPQLGYNNDHGGLKTDDGFMFDCATSAAFREEKKLLMKVQIIDRYFGNILITLSFKDDIAYVSMNKIAEAFLEEYHGSLIAHL